MNHYLNILCIIAGVPVAGFVGFVIFVRLSQPRRLDRQEADLLQLQKELGLTPYTKAERAAMLKEERRQYDDNARAEAFWSGSKTYRDYDGNEKSL